MSDTWEDELATTEADLWLNTTDPALYVLNKYDPIQTEWIPATPTTSDQIGAVGVGEDYNGTIIDDVNGLTSTRTDGLVRTIANAVGGLKIQKRPTVADAWTDIFYVDTNGYLYVMNAKIDGELIGDVIAGGTVVGSSFRSGSLSTPIKFYVGDENTDAYNVLSMYFGSVRMPDSSLTTNGNHHSANDAALHRFYIGTGTSYNIMSLTAANATINGNLGVTGTINGTTVGSSSDQRLKCQIEPHEADDLQDLVGIDLIKFNYLYEPLDAHRHIGFIAQNGPQDVVIVDEDGLLGIDMYSLLSKSIGAIQQLNAKVDEQQRKIDAILTHLNLEV